VLEVVELDDALIDTVSEVDDDAVVSDDDAAVDLAADTGFNTDRLDVPDEIA
jgi:hypothetical protein